MINTSFSAVAKSVEALNGDAQALLAEELRERIASLTELHLTDAQRAEVQRRLSLPRHHVDASYVRDILKRYTSLA